MKLQRNALNRLTLLTIVSVSSLMLSSCGTAGDVPPKTGDAAPKAGDAPPKAPQREDWPQWGGNDGRNMVTDEKNLPDSWEPGPKDRETEEYDTTKSKNLKWVAKLGSHTYGNPTVSNGKIFLGTNNAAPRNPKYKDIDLGVLMCFNEADGKYLWQLTVPKLKSGKVNDWEYLGICSSPTVDGDRVYCVTNRCELLCLSTEGLAKGNRGPFKNEGQYAADPDLLKGKKPDELANVPTDADGADIIWRLDMIDEMGVFPHNASNCSVMIDGNKLYCCTSNGVDWGHDNVPATEAPSYFCCDKMTGEILWVDEIGMGKAKRADCGLNRAIFHGLWTSPALGTVSGKKQVYFGGGDGFCYALDADDGKVVWKVDCVLPTHKKGPKGFILYPDYKGPSEINATPVLYKNRVYVAVGQDPDHGEGVGVLTCIDATKTGDITDTGKIWIFDKIQRSISTCSIYNDLLFVADYSGNIYCLDPDNGKLHWMFPSGSHIWGSTLAGDGKVYFGNEDGDAVILAADKTLKEIGKTNVGSPIFGTPITANGVLYITTETHLFAIHKK